MAVNSPGGVIFFLSIPIEQKHHLGTIRHWPNLKTGTEEGLVWVKGLDSFQVDSVEIKSIPYKNLYYQSGEKLFVKGSLLPDRNLPNILWSPIERGLPVDLPGMNHNFFGVNQKLHIKITVSENEVAGFGLLVSLTDLKKYIETAAATRLKNLSWCIVNDKALILGSPLLPLQGEVYWRRDDFLLPVGFDLELPTLAAVINGMIDPGKNRWVIWGKDGSYFNVEKLVFTELSISSFRLSMKKNGTATLF